MTSTKTPPPEREASGPGALADVERLVDRLLGRSLDSPHVIMEIDIPELRRALAAASQEDLDGVMRLAVGQVTASGTEMLVRSLLALRSACEEHDRRDSPSGQEYPRVAAEAERVERVVRFLVEIFGDYAKARRLAKLAKREDSGSAGTDNAPGKKTPKRSHTPKKKATKKPGKKK